MKNEENISVFYHNNIQTGLNNKNIFNEIEEPYLSKLSKKELENLLLKQEDISELSKTLSVSSILSKYSDIKTSDSLSSDSSSDSLSSDSLFQSNSLFKSDNSGKRKRKY